MPRVGETHVLSSDAAGSFAAAHTQLSTGAGPSEQTMTLSPKCAALLLSAKTANCFVTFNNVAASATSGIDIISGAQPVFIPLGVHAHPGTAGACILRVQGSAANAVLNVVQLA